MNPLALQLRIPVFWFSTLKAQTLLIFGNIHRMIYPKITDVRVGARSVKSQYYLTMIELKIIICLKNRPKRIFVLLPTQCLVDRCSVHGNHTLRDTKLTATLYLHLQTRDSTKLLQRLQFYTKVTHIIAKCI